MNKISELQQIHISDYNYLLPEDRIAKYPLEERDSSKLLVYNNGKIEESVFFHISDYLPSDSLLIYNDTRVIQARMYFNKPTGAKIEIFCLEPCLPHDYALNLGSRGKCSWICLIGNSKKWKDGFLSKQISISGQKVNVTANKIKSTGESHIIEFEWDNSDISFSELLETGGELPIPPYLNRETEEEDKRTYQTVYSKVKGSVAAPTAGLHFTPQVFDKLDKKGIRRDEITLHVGAGTFKPVKTETIGSHVMHSEYISVSRNTISDLLNHKGKIIAVGTTSVRTLESLYYIGSLLENEESQELRVTQWLPYDEKNNKISVEQALKNILDCLDVHNLNTLIADTQIMIVPGYEFKIVDGMITNFHQPQSTLLLLVSAFVGGDWKRIYDYALAHDFRFLSYGDSSLLFRV
ncbi:MAG: S-adenosylmethionine:tRNA ribosyltransferase-isomerase [Dysgonomonas sp.]